MSTQINPSLPVDPFNPENFRLSQNFGQELGIQKLLTTVPVQKPGKEHWIRVHASESYHLDTLLLVLKEANEIYLVNPSLQESLAEEPTCNPYRLVLSITRQNTPFLWPLRLPKPSGKVSRWNESALSAAATAKKQWVRVTSNMNSGSYDVTTAMSKIPEPRWPEQSFQELLRIAFKDRVIDNAEHPVLRELRGEI